MRLTARQYASAVVDYLQKNPSKEGETAAALLPILRKNRQEKLLSRILMIVEHLWREQQGHLPVLVTVAKELSAEEIDTLKISLEKIFPKKIDLKQKVDSSVKGGIALRVGDDLYDATLATRLRNLEQTFMHS